MSDVHTVTSQDRSNWGNKVVVMADIVISTYAAGGAILTAAELGLMSLEQVFIESSGKGGYLVSYDPSTKGLIVYQPETAHAHGMNSHTHGVALDTGASAAGSSHNHVFTGTPITPEAITITDSDTAATAGVAVYLHTHDGRTGWFEFVSPTNADGTGTLNNGGSGYFIFDADIAATDGVAIYCDEDAATVDRRLMCVSPSGKDIYVPVAGSAQVIRIAHNANAAADGVAVYFDEDAANTYGRLLFVSPTNANAAGATDDTYYGLSSVPAGTNAAESTHTHGPGTLADAASAAATGNTANNTAAVASEKSAGALSLTVRIIAIGV